MWFLFTVATLLFWGCADLFYKKGADEADRYSHLKTSVMVGLVMGLHALYMLVFGDLHYDFMNLIIYLPVSLMYILSMTIGYFGLRYLEVSISSPIQNTSGAIVCIMCLLILGQTMDALSAVAVVIICISVFALGILEKRRQNEYELRYDRKYKIGFVAFMMPILYCIFDALGTFFDAYYLDDFTTTPLRNVTEETFEDVANVSYELTFFVIGVVLLIYLLAVKKEKFNILDQRDRGIAAIFETAGQFTYVYAMSGNGVVAAPVVASYCVVSVILGRIFLKEKLSKPQYAVISAVVVGIALLGLAEGLAA